MEITKSLIKKVAIPLLIVVSLPTFWHVLNRANNKEVKTESYFLGSRTKFPAGHIEYVRLKDGSETIIEFSRAGHLGPILISRNLDGDDEIDIIRENSSISYKLKKFLVREIDYPTNKEEFDEKNKLLLEERNRYSGKF